MLRYVETYKPDLLIIDESIESIVRKGILIPPQYRPLIKFERINCDSCPAKDKWKTGLIYYNNSSYCEYTQTILFNKFKQIEYPTPLKFHLSCILEIPAVFGYILSQKSDNISYKSLALFSTSSGLEKICLDFLK